MTTGISTSSQRPELLQVADIVAREKGIEFEEVLEAMELAIQKAGRAKYGAELDIRTKIDPKTGEIALFRYREVVEEIAHEQTQLLLEEAKKLDPEIEMGGFIIETLPPVELGRVSAQMAKQVIVQRVREAERERQFADFKDRVGEIVSGVVKRTEYGSVTVDLGRTESVLRRDELLPRESFRPGDRIRAYIVDVRREQRGPQIFLSRTHPQFMAKLFAQEVPEIYDGLIEIRAVARDPGSRAKLAVFTKEMSIDPVGACVGMRGSRVLAVVNELQGEKVDIIPWSEEPATFIVNALAPAEISKVLIDEETQNMEVVVPDDQLSLAIGRRGQNVRLATILTGWHINILTETEEAERRQEELKVKSQLFTAALGVDEVLAHLLVAEGFDTLQEVAFVIPEELATIEGIGPELGEELQSRARDYIEKRAKELEKKLKTLKVSEDLKTLEGLDLEMVVALGEQKIKTRDDLADLAGDELKELLPTFKLTQDKANKIIMDARAHWFEKEEKPEDPVEETS